MQIVYVEMQDMNGKSIQILCSFIVFIIIIINIQKQVTINRHTNNTYICIICGNC